MKRVLFLVLILSVVTIPHLLQAQSVRNVTSEYDYVMPETVSLSEAKRIAVERAKIKAIEDEFGSVVYQNNHTSVKNRSGESTIDFLSIGGSDVKGEWLKDLAEPTTEMIERDGVLVIRASVKGKAREIVRAKIDIQTKILRNGITAQDESDTFINGNNIYMLFKSPRNGFLTVYLLGENGDAYSLLPYQRSLNGVFEVKKDHEYILFDIDSASKENQDEIDEYTLTANKKSEVNYLYIIFSPNEFTKASDNGGGELIPRSLTFDEFQKWLTKNRNVDAEMQVLSRSIEIRAE